MLLSRQYDIIRHSLGMRNKSSIPDEYYRNRYVAGDNHNETDVLNGLVELGYMTKSEPIESFGGDRMWTVTDEGIKQFELIFKTKKNEG